MNFDPADPPANEWPQLETDALERLAWWQARRARDEERRRVEEALAKAPAKRSAADWTTLSYSPFGTGQGCGCR